jgi:FRG1-like family./PPPDE putative peptidase domain.
MNANFLNHTLVAALSKSADVAVRRFGLLPLNKILFPAMAILFITLPLHAQGLTANQVATYRAAHPRTLVTRQVKISNGFNQPISLDFYHSDRPDTIFCTFEVEPHRVSDLLFNNAPLIIAQDWAIVVRFGNGARSQVRFVGDVCQTTSDRHYVNSAVVCGEPHLGVVPPIGGGMEIALQSWMGTFVCAEHGGGGIVVVNRPIARTWETYWLTRIDEDHVALRTANGHYLCADNGGGSVVVANRNRVGDWEKFHLLIHNNGLVSLKTHNGMFVCADTSGVLTCNRKKAGEWESFRIVHPQLSETEQYRVVVSVYELGVAPFWHTGTVIDGREYYFASNGKVVTCNPGEFHGLGDIDVATLRRQISRLAPHPLEDVTRIKEQVIMRWSGTRYDLSSHNCDFFTDDLLQSLGVAGLDQEYLNCSGLGKGLRQLPEGSTISEVFFRWPVSEKRLDHSFMEDLSRLRRVPEDTINELHRLGGDAAREAKNAGGEISAGVKHIFGQR